MQLNRFALLISALFILDRAAKLLAASILSASFLTYRINIAFGSRILSVILSLIGIALFYFFLQKKVLKPTHGIALMLTGILANTFDRALYGGAIDFIRVSSFPLFNFADIYILIGLCLFVAEFMRRKHS